ncbi:hypothetical protein BEWA_046380 [Theileria equi strain WA]|uniref:Uncharacterized protein n=1 Tax=Theileria equi strain WA TaxID=1537102 RepID=L1LA84_THEEQ|nr:hypothetical protein BEWA_046380 [Theileria equi strain WA]EKX72174.1 hypothetical protein BEWA_046380 [Theileria equi strain WA]|eukprot:XP_004831626.1 hypothetical protein BEWA_046380 [Theileria equi strain WA]
MANTCRSYSWNYVNVEINQTKSSYKDACGNEIKVYNLDGDKFPGYRLYVHKIPQGQFWLGGIYHRDKQQTGFGYIHKYHTDVKTYYVDYDYGYLVPLLLGLKRFDHDYYERENYITGSGNWKKCNIIDDNTRVKNKLNDLSKNLKEFIVVKTDASGKTYYANGKTSSAPKVNGEISITVSSSVYDGAYKLYKHVRKDNDTIRVLSAMHSDVNVPFDYPVYGTKCSEVLVYYWEGDSSHTNPLLLELKQTLNTSQSYYRLSSGGTDKKWTPAGVINAGNLKDNLDKLNCEKNKAHVMDISKAESTTYNCSGCGNTRITVVDSKITAEDYIKTTHKIENGDMIGKLASNGYGQDGINYTKDRNTVTVFRYPLSGEPILLYYSGTWYKKAIKTNQWKEITNQKVPADDNSTFDIKKILLDVYAPWVTINLDKTQYKEKYYEEDLEITVEEGDDQNEYRKLTHVRRGGVFRVKAIVHHGSPLIGIESNEPLGSVSAYYYLLDGKKEGPLAIELSLKTSSGYKYDYYIEDPHSGEWIPFSWDGKREGAQMGYYEITKQLKDAKEIHITRKKGSGPPPGAIAAALTLAVGVVCVAVYYRYSLRNMGSLIITKAVHTINRIH